MKLKIIEKSNFYSIENTRVIIGFGVFFEKNYDFMYSLNPFDPVAEILQEEISRRVIRTDANGISHYKFSIPPVDFLEIANQVFPFSTLHPYNYFHSLIEDLPILHYLISNDLLEDNAVILTSHLPSSIYKALQFVIGKKPVRIMQLNFMDSVYCSRLITAPSPAHANEKKNGSTPQFILNPEMLISLRLFFSSLWGNTTNDKIFISRKSSYRQMINQDEINQIATSNGYKVVDPGQLSFIDQIKIFSSAKYIVGPTGAWLANLLFISDKAHVTVIFPKIEENPPPSIWTKLANCFGIEIKEFFADVVNLNVNQPIQSDYRVSNEDILKILQR